MATNRRRSRSAKSRVNDTLEASGSDKIPTSPPKKAAPSAAEVEYEFGGPFGAAAVMVGLPAVIYMLYFLCNENVCMKSPLSFDWNRWLGSLPTSSAQLWSNEGTLIFLGWFAFQAAMQIFLPGEVVQGSKVKNTAETLPYTMSGHLQFWLSALACCYVIPVWSNREGTSVVQGLNRLPLELLYDHYVGLITASCLFSLLLSLYLYRRSFTPGAVLADGGDTGSAVYDFFIGRELNPRTGTYFDWKCFCELRPGLIGWAIINAGMACKQSAKLGHISLSMLAIVLSQGLYVWDALYQERAILSTMDITTDGFGFMLAFGDLAWVPFIYSLQARYLVDHDPYLSVTQVCGCMLLQAVGYYIFRAANSQKDAFRRDPISPEVSHLSYMPTRRGTRLITSGWWGAARKINYTGDYLITLSWCLLCGGDSVIPYFQAVYFAILLVHRARRDDMMCSEKYGEDWQEYKRRVPYIFVPYIV